MEVPKYIRYYDDPCYRTGVVVLTGFAVDEISRATSLRTLLRQSCRQLNRAFFWYFFDRGGVPFVNRDWDNLIILDGCRYDLFQQSTHPLEGDLCQVRSPASSSGEFIEKNFIGRRLHDTVYITANPFATKIPSGTFHFVDNCLEEEYNPDLGTVEPEKVAGRTISAHDRFPSKRIIAHFMQPHYPFIGDHGQTINIDSAIRDENEKSPSVWDRFQLELERPPKNDVWTAYLENLELVLSVVDGLVDDLTGKTVITSDHGNLFGEREFPLPVRGYGHQHHLHVDELIDVPWFECKVTERRDTTTDEPVDSVRSEMCDVEEQLTALGYRR